MKLGRRLGFFNRLIHIQGPALLTSRSAVILLALVYLFLGPIQVNNDIVSASLAYGLLIVVTLVAVLVITQGALIRKRVRVEVRPPEAGLVSGDVVRIVLSTTPVRILPFTYLDMTLDFEQPGLEPATLRLTGFRLDERRAFIDLTFPHRGSWNVRGVRLEVGDVAKLSRLSWYLPLGASPRVYAPVIQDNSLPILSSSQRPGELVIDTLNRQGDPFDIKVYHPADGVKRIVWKAFAKRGELLSRHPEASMTPEGYVVVMVLARPQDDAVCSRVDAYVTNLEELKLDLALGCEGQGTHAFATTADSTRELLVDSVWDASHSDLSTLQRDATALLDFCTKAVPSVRIAKIVLFCSGERLADPVQQDLLRSFGSWLSERGVAPVFCVNAYAGALSSAKATQLGARASRWFTLHDHRAPLSNTSANSYNAFMTACLQRQWEVYL
jgi:hypothetical protein